MICIPNPAHKRVSLAYIWSIDQSIQQDLVPSRMINFVVIHTNQQGETCLVYQLACTMYVTHSTFTQGLKLILWVYTLYVYTKKS